jgi:hypothetical protein
LEPFAGFIFLKKSKSNPPIKFSFVLHNSKQMKSLFSFFFFAAISLSAWNQCNVVTTAMPQPATCNGDCDGSIIYMYQNIGAPGVPYIVILEDSDGNTLSFTTHIGEFETIPFTGLCADTYSITIQGSSCSNTLFTIVSEPSPIVVYANTTDPSLGLDNGICSLIASGGTSPYIFSIDGGATFQPSNTFSNLPAGSYTGIVQDANGCEEEIDITLTDNTGCSVVVTANPTAMPMCYGACSGAFQYMYNDANNNSPYLIELTQGGATLQTATNNLSNGGGTFTNLCAGVYYVEVTDAQGCTGSYPITISQPTQLLISGVSTTDASSGNNDGSATITASGGSPAYTYSIDGTTYQLSNIFTGLDAGVYIGYVKDANGCISIYTFVIQENPGCFFNVTAMPSHPSCTWSCDGSINYIFAGMATDPPFSIVLESNGTMIQSATSPNQTVSSTFTGLCAGDYTLTVSNSSGCSEIVNVTLTQPNSILLTASTVSASIGNSDGSITLTATGGTAPYQFSIDNQATWQSSSTFTSLDAGVYIIYAQDANGCTSILTVVVNETAGCNFFLAATSLSTSCSNSCDGSVIYSFNDPGNNPTYTIDLIQGTNTIQTQSVTLSNGGTGTFTNLCEGVYTVLVTDANGCTDTETIYVDSPDYLVVSNVDVSDASAGNSDGEAEVTVTGGTAPYQYSLDNGTTWQSSNILSNLAAGFYIMHVEDANGCQTIFCFIVNEDPGCTIATTLFLNQPISCFGSCDGVLGYAYSEGTPNPPYTLTISNNGTAISTTTHTTNAFNGVATNLCAGNYSISVTNGDGCLSYVSNYTLTQPDQIIISANVTDASTGNSNGVAEILVTGGTGQYAYSLDGTGFQTSNVFDTLSAGIYVVTVHDANGCSDNFTFMVGENSNCNIVLTATITQTVTCSGACNGVVTFAFNDVNTNPPYTVTLSNIAGVTNTQVFTTGNGGSGNFPNVCAGDYVVSVQDADGCESFYTIQLTQPDYLMVTTTQVDATSGNADGSITLNVTGGTAPYEFSTDGGTSWQTSNTLTNLSAGFYIIHVKDANGCSQIICVILGDSNVIGVVELTEEISICPNPTQGLVFVESADIESVIIYNMNGQLISTVNTFTTNGIVVDLTENATGIYVIEVKTKNGEISRAQVVKN